MHECARGGMDDRDAFASSLPHARRVVTPHALQSSHHRIAVVSLARECTPRTCASTAPATPRESAPLDTFSANSFKPARAATGLVDLSFVRRARVVSLRPFVPRRALGGLSSPANVRSRGRSIPRPRRRRRVDDARAGARRARGADEEKFPHLKPPLRRPPTRPARASRVVEIAPDRSRDPLAIGRPVVDRASSAPSSHRARARGARDTHTRTAWWPSPP